jgi:hypothetical protein
MNQVLRLAITNIEVLHEENQQILAAESQPNPELDL